MVSELQPERVVCTTHAQHRAARVIPRVVSLLLFPPPKKLRLLLLCFAYVCLLIFREVMPVLLLKRSKYATFMPKKLHLCYFMLFKKIVDLC